MFVKRICFPIQVLGPGNRVGIWLAGCNKRCPGCMSPELQTTNGCSDCSVEEIESILSHISGEIEGVTISGGEPFLQADELSELICYIDREITRDIIVYTGYQIEELRKKGSPSIEKILSSISVLIDGEYIDELNDGIGIRGSKNQRIHVLRNVAIYDELSTTERNLQTFRYNGQILVVGIQ